MAVQRTILLAEDDALARLSLTGLLTQQGYRVVAVEDGMAAWAILEADGAPPVVLLDWMMPGMAGPEVLQKLHQRPTRRSCYVILLTARSSPEDISASLNLGAQDFVSKPFNQEELLARIRVAFRTIELETSLAERVAELEKAIQRITQLEGILPICAMCKKIRDSDEKWNSVEEYFKRHAPVDFSHGYCPECFAREMNALASEEPPNQGA
jgi:DNA-binding response OmpR family regulator